MFNYILETSIYLFTDIFIYTSIFLALAKCMYDIKKINFLKIKIQTKNTEIQVISGDKIVKQQEQEKVKNYVVPAKSNMSSIKITTKNSQQDKNEEVFYFNEDTVKNMTICRKKMKKNFYFLISVFVLSIASIASNSFSSKYTKWPNAKDHFYEVVVDVGTKNIEQITLNIESGIFIDKFVLYPENGKEKKFMIPAKIFKNQKYIFEITIYAKKKQNYSLAVNSSDLKEKKVLLFIPREKYKFKILGNNDISEKLYVFNGKKKITEVNSSEIGMEPSVVIDQPKINLKNFYIVSQKSNERFHCSLKRIEENILLIRKTFAFDNIFYRRIKYKLRIVLPKVVSDEFLVQLRHELEKLKNKTTNEIFSVTGYRMGKKYIILTSKIKLASTAKKPKHILFKLGDMLQKNIEIDYRKLKSSIFWTESVKTIKGKSAVLILYTQPLTNGDKIPNLLRTLAIRIVRKQPMNVYMYKGNKLSTVDQKVLFQKWRQKGPTVSDERYQQLFRELNKWKLTDVKNLFILAPGLKTNTERLNLSIFSKTFPKTFPKIYMYAVYSKNTSDKMRRRMSNLSVIDQVEVYTVTTKQSFRDILDLKEASRDLVKKFWNKFHFAK